MKRELFRRYVWLVDTVRKAKRLQFEEIADKWMDSPLNADHSPLALRTFHNHRHIIKNLFGIRIVCNRADRHRYHIEGVDTDNSVRLRIWMLQQLYYSGDRNPVEMMERKIILDTFPEEKFGLNTIIEALREDRVVRIVYPSNGDAGMLLEPLCLRYWRNNWYVVGRDCNYGRLQSLCLERIARIEVTDTTFEYPSDFSPGEYFKSVFGEDVGPDNLPMHVMLKVGGVLRERLRATPLQASQKEVMALRDYSVFEYYMIVGDDFKKAMLAMGPEIEVLAPERLRSDIVARVELLAEKYSSQHKKNL